VVLCFAKGYLVFSLSESVGTHSGRDGIAKAAVPSSQRIAKSDDRGALGATVHSTPRILLADDDTDMRRRRCTSKLSLPMYWRSLIASAVKTVDIYDAGSRTNRTTLSSKGIPRF
jgi:hypothetical protein